MGYDSGYDCGHECCDERHNCSHSHTLDPKDCRFCDIVKENGILPPVLTTEQGDKRED